MFACVVSANRKGVGGVSLFLFVASFKKKSLSLLKAAQECIVMHFDMP